MFHLQACVCLSLETSCCFCCPWDEMRTDHLIMRCLSSALIFSLKEDLRWDRRPCTDSQDDLSSQMDHAVYTVWWRRSGSFQRVKSNDMSIFGGVLLQIFMHFFPLTGPKMDWTNSVLFKKQRGNSLWTALFTLKVLMSSLRSLSAGSAAFQTHASCFLRSVWIKVET